MIRIHRLLLPQNKNLNGWCYFIFKLLCFFKASFDSRIFLSQKDCFVYHYRNIPEISAVSYEQVLGKEQFQHHSKRVKAESQKDTVKTAECSAQSCSTECIHTVLDRPPAITPCFFYCRSIWSKEEKWIVKPTHRTIRKLLQQLKFHGLPLPVAAVALQSSAHISSFCLTQ